MGVGGQAERSLHHFDSVFVCVCFFFDFVDRNSEVGGFTVNAYYGMVCARLLVGILEYIQRGDEVLGCLFWVQVRAVGRNVTHTIFGSSRVGLGVRLRGLHPDTSLCCAYV